MASGSLHSILAPVDFSTCSRAGLEFACALAASLNAKVEVLFVHDRTSTSAANEERDFVGTREELRRFIASVPAARDLPLNERVEIGDARERIVSIAEGKRFDAIVIGTHGRTGRAHSLAGSVAESVVRTASCPVITVRERS
ncbi:MAG TPA: universal stress protein [Polyangiaceae bacterium]|jgi:universal stress protein A